MTDQPSEGDIVLLEVVNVDDRLGCFLEAGLDELVLLPMSQLPREEDLRPQVGDHVYVRTEEGKNGKWYANLAGELDFEPLTFIAPDAWKNQWFEATVYNPLDIGTFVLCEGGVLGFGVMGLIHELEQTRPLRLGEKVRVRVTYVRDDGRINCSMREPKEVSRKEDAERILDYLKETRDGAMPYSDKTPADVIKSKFNISKAAFKRALGKLMKDNKIEQKENWTYLIKRDEE